MAEFLGFARKILITLFGNLDSGNDHKVQLILKHIGKPYKRVSVYQTKNEPRDERFLKLNPIGKIPVVLLENGDIISESNAILFYFAKGSNLWKNEHRTQTEILRWLFFEQYSHEPTLAVMRYLINYTDQSVEREGKIEELRPKAEGVLDTMESYLRDRDWFASDKVTIADYALYPYTKMANESGFNLDSYEAIKKWLNRFESQPRFIPLGKEGAEETCSFSSYFQNSA